MLRRIEDGDDFGQVIVARVNAAIDKINELADLHGDGMTIAIDPAMNWEVRCLLEPAAPGGSADAPVGYSGYFKVIDASERDASGAITAPKVKIVNGASPDDADCGDTDLGTVAAQEVAYTLPAASARHHVYLRAKYATGTYSFDFLIGDDSAKPETPYGYFVLADVDSKGAVTQVWQSGFIYWASRYYT